MRRMIGGRAYELVDHVRDDETALNGFLHLAKAVFSLDFAPWLAGGWWGGDYIPHALMDGEKVVANVSANLIRSRWNGGEKRFLQLGTVMTDREYRGRGLARHLMEEVMARYAGACDGVYLYANDSVLDFYPKFGFKAVQETQHSLPVGRSGEHVRKLDMDDPGDRATLLNAYRAQGNRHCALPIVGNEGLLMFYCGQFLKDCVYELPGLNAVAVAEYDGGRILCYDVFGGTAPLPELLNALAREDTRFCALGFTPLNPAGCAAEPRREQDTTLFASGALAPLFQENQVMFPLLSHA